MKQERAMLLFAILFLMVFYNLFNVISEESNTFYKDIRFWLVLISLGILIWMITQSYPA